MPMLMDFTDVGRTRMQQVVTDALVFQVSHIAYGSSGFNPVLPTAALALVPGATGLVSEFYRKAVPPSQVTLDTVGPFRGQETVFTSLSGVEATSIFGEAGLIATVTAPGTTGLAIGDEFLLAQMHSPRIVFSLYQRLAIKWPLDLTAPAIIYTSVLTTLNDVIAISPVILGGGFGAFVLTSGSLPGSLALNGVTGDITGTVGISDLLASTPAGDYTGLVVTADATVASPPFDLRILGITLPDPEAVGGVYLSGNDEEAVTNGTAASMAAPNSGAVASMAAVSGGEIVVSGLTGISTNAAGNAYLTTAGAAAGVNNGTFLIQTVISATSVSIVAGAATGADANNGALTWTETDSLGSAVLEVTGVDGMTAGYVNGNLSVAGAAAGANNGSFTIASFVSRQAVYIVAGVAVGADANNGALTWNGPEVMNSADGARLDTIGSLVSGPAIVTGEARTGPRTAGLRDNTTALSKTAKQFSALMTISLDLKDATDQNVWSHGYGPAVDTGVKLGHDAVGDKFRAQWGGNAASTAIIGTTTPVAATTYALGLSVRADVAPNQFGKLFVQGVKEAEAASAHDVDFGANPFEIGIHTLVPGEGHVGPFEEFLWYPTLDLSEDQHATAAWLSLRGESLASWIKGGSPGVPTWPTQNLANGVAVVLSPTATSTDPDTDTVTYIPYDALPTGLSLNPTTGDISGTPSVNGHYPLRIGVTDGMHLVVSPTFTLIVS